MDVWEWNGGNGSRTRVTGMGEAGIAKVLAARLYTDQPSDGRLILAALLLLGGDKFSNRSHAGRFKSSIEMR